MVVAPQRMHWCSTWVPSAATVIPVIVHTCSTQAGASSSLTATVSQPEEGHAMPKQITEAAPLSVAASASGSGTIPIVLITPGWGSSGYYPAKVLENAAKAGVFGQGLHLYLDHPGEAERYDRPERSVRDLVATLAGDAVWDGTQLVGEVTPFGAAAEMLTDKEFASAVGLSIRAYADSTIGEAEGRKGQIITEITEAISVDFVTRAGRGGRVLVELMESARPEQVVERAVAVGVAEATANDTRAALSAALKDSYGGDKSWVWVRDFDETTVWFEYETPDVTGIYGETYDLDEQGVLTLSGSPVEVRARTEYVPVTPAAESAPNVPAPAGRPTPTPKSQEDTMGTIQVDEAEHGRLAEAAGRVTALESERAQAIAERDEAREALAVERRTARANTLIDTAEAGFTALERRGLLAELPLTQEGALDEDAFTATVTEAAATRAEASGAGSIRGFGRTGNDTGTVTEADVDNAVGSAFGRTPKEA